MMRHRILLTASILLLLVSAASPSRAVGPDRPRDSLNVELLGRGIVCSLNGEIGLGRHFAAGAGFFPMVSGYENTYILPLYVSWLSHETKGLFLSAGVTWVWGNATHDETNQTLTCGAQFATGRRTYLRITLTRFNLFDEDEEMELWDWDLLEDVTWPGVTFGWRF